MATVMTQDNRFGQLTTPLGGDKLVLLRMSGEEALGETYCYRVEALTDEAEIDETQVIGHPCAVALQVYASETRYFHGICTEMRWLGRRNSRNLYLLILRPWFWLLTLQSDCRLFKEKSVDDILKEVFKGSGFGDVEFKLRASYPKLPYTTQYMETHYDFALRLMERHGLYFYFKHEKSKHTLVVCDNDGAHVAAPGYATVPYYEDNQVQRERDHLTDLSMARRLRADAVDVGDYNYTRASTKLTGTHKTAVKHGSKGNKLYAFPAGFDESANGKTVAQVILEARRADAERVFASGNAAGLGAGNKVKIDRNPLGQGNADFLVVRATHTIVSDTYASTAGVGSVEEPYHGTFEMQMLSEPFRLPLEHPWPRIVGPHTAKVVGKKGEEIDVDDQGRILALFPWDEEGVFTRRVRVVQPWAGKSWGTFFIPRIGQEVVVEFIDGDPDRPLVVGAVYNSDHKPPIKLPADKTQSTIKSESSKGGGGFNEIRFEDKKGAEEIYIHAQKDRLTEILNDDTLQVHNNQTEEIGTKVKKKGDRKVTVHNDDTLILKEGKLTTTVEKGDEIRTVKMGKRTTTIQGKETLTVKQGDQMTEVKMGKQTTKIKMGDQITQLDMGKQTTTLKMGDQITTLKMGSQKTTLDLGSQTNTLKLGNQTNKLSVGKHATQALQGIELKVGGNSIKIDMMGITIKGMMVKIEGSVMLEAKGGAIAKVQGSAMLQLQGGIAMIN